MAPNDMLHSNDNPPRASLLGLPVELRQLIYEYVFAPIDHRRKRFLDSYSEVERIYLGIQRLSGFFCDNGIDQWQDIAFKFAGSAQETQRHPGQREHLTALLSVPCVCWQIRRELRDMVSGLPPISKIRLVFIDFTKSDMEMFVDAIGETNTRHVRKWSIYGTARCASDEFRDGHLFEGYSFIQGRPGPCSFFDNGEHRCDFECIQLPPQLKKKQCQRHVAIDLDKHEEQQIELVTANTRWEKEPRVENNVKAEDRLHELKSKLSHERETAKTALLKYGRAEVSSCYNSEKSSGSCYFSDPLDPLFDMDGELRVTKQTFVRMLEAVTEEGPREESF